MFGGSYVSGVCLMYQESVLGVRRVSFVSDGCF